MKKKRLYWFCARCGRRNKLVRTQCARCKWQARLTYRLACARVLTIAG